MHSDHSRDAQHASIAAYYPKLSKIYPCAQLLITLPPFQRGTAMGSKGYSHEVKTWESAGDHPLGPRQDWCGHPSRQQWETSFCQHSDVSSTAAYSTPGLKKGTG